MAWQLIPVWEGQQWIHHNKITKVVMVAAANSRCFLTIYQDMASLKKLSNKYHVSPLEMGLHPRDHSQLKIAQVGKALDKPPYPTRHLDSATQDITQEQLFVFAADWKQQLAVTAWDHQSILQHILLAQRLIKLQSQVLYLCKAENL